MLDLEALKKLCTKDIGRQHLLEPLLLDFEGERWTIATDGHFMPGVRGELATDAVPEWMTDSTRSLLSEPPGAIAHADGVERLRSLAGLSFPCAACGNTGSVPRRCVCRDCGSDHPVDPRMRSAWMGCPVCRDRISIQIDGVPIDAARIACLLRDVPDGLCRWAATASPPLIWFAGEGWRGVLVGTMGHYEKRVADYSPAVEVTP